MDILRPSFTMYWQALLKRMFYPLASSQVDGMAFRPQLMPLSPSLV
jgi:hypothetical protein